jgi:hypothetical protein
MVAAVRISNLTNTPEIRLHPMIFYKFKIFWQERLKTPGNSVFVFTYGSVVLLIEGF